MKKFFASLFMAAIFLYSSVAMAAYEETVNEDSDLGSIKTLAIALPMHYKIELTEPNVMEFSDIIFNAGRLAQCEIISYDDIVDNIWHDAKIDIKALADNDSRRIFTENVAKYADAYLLVTSANNNKFNQFFFEVRDAKDGSMMYLFNTQSRYYGKNLKGYTKACEDFYGRFNSVVQKAAKKKKG